MSKTCSKCPALADKKTGMCKEHWAEYMREYRERSDGKRERAYSARGFEEGVRACVECLRTRHRDAPLTGFQAALVIERAMLDAPSFEVTNRRAAIAALRQ